MESLIDGATDLRSGLTIWEARNSPLVGRSELPRDVSVDVLIVGAGITGAFLAERLSRRGKTILVIDRRGLQRGSTAASTALLSWELDTSMLELERLRGFRAAAAIHRRSQDTVKAIGALTAHHGIPCHFAWRDSIYLSGSTLDPTDLREELQVRAKAGIDGRFVLSAELAATEGVIGEAALVSPGSAEADPVALARGLLAVAAARGAVIAAPVTAVTYEGTGSGVVVATDRDAVIRAEALVLATGYEMPEFVPASIHRVVSTWALATEPMVARGPWSKHAIVWEASDPYLYMRTTSDCRIVAGGEDEELTDAAARDALTVEKTGRILAKVGALLSNLDVGHADFAWSGFFGRTEDGLPLIGPVPGMPHCFGAYGYGGNGITFSAMASVVIDRMIAGEKDADAELLALDRQL